MSKAGYIAIVGRPNAGKSTLLNAVLQSQLSIVTPKAQTTREQVRGILTEKRGQVIFVDTPGIHKARPGGFNEFMVQEAESALEAPNLVWYLVDPHSEFKHEETVLGILEKCRAPVFLLMNKSDQVGKNLKQVMEEKANQLEQDLTAAMKARGIALKESIRISALKKKGISELLDLSWPEIPEGPPFYSDEDQLSDRPMRFFVAEKIREQLFMQLGDEIPYSCAVQIDKFKEDAEPIRIEATIFVERDSQKGMVIGQGGKKIKAIGQAARTEIEPLVGGKIFLGLRVKVLKDWTKNAEAYKKMGILAP